MSIFDYTKKNHPAGFVGYRVSIMVEGDHKQKYFSTNGMTASERLSKYVQARELEKTWIKDKEKAMQKFRNEAAPTKRSTRATGVRGISIGYVYSPDKKGNKRAYKHLRYIVQGSHFKEVFHGTFPVTEKGWKDAVKFLAKNKNLTRWKHLLERNPSCHA